MKTADRALSEPGSPVNVALTREKKTEPAIDSARGVNNHRTPITNGHRSSNIDNTKFMPPKVAEKPAAPKPTAENRTVAEPSTSVP